MITISHLTKIYEGDGQRVTALEDVSLHIEKGDVYGVIGMSGAGKSTLLRCLTHLERPTSGEILLSGQNLAALSGARLRAARRGMGVVFQGYNLLMQKTVAENVAFPLKLEKGYDKAAVSARVAELLELVGLGGRARAYPAQLSGGQKQRVAIARMLLQNTPILIFDDSLSAVDAETDAAIRDALHGRRHGTMFLISHRIATLRQADLILVMDKGRVVQMGTHAELCAADGLYRRVCAIQNELDAPGPDAPTSEGGAA